MRVNTRYINSTRGTSSPSLHFNCLKVVLKEEPSLVRGQFVWKYNGMVMVLDKIVLKAGEAGGAGGRGGGGGANTTQ